MASILLRLMLIVSLTFNWSAGSWAGVSHGPDSAASADQGHSHGHHGGPAHDADQSATAHEHGGKPGHHHGGKCCDGTTCQCGCVLPPALPFALAIGIARSPLPAPTLRPVRHVASAPRAELLRPPIA